MVSKLLPKMKGKERKERIQIHFGPHKFCETYISAKLARLVGAR